jgi:hypothetical protein
MANGTVVKLRRLLLTDWEEAMRIYVGLLYELFLSTGSDGLTIETAEKLLPSHVTSKIGEKDDFEQLSTFFGYFITEPEVAVVLASADCGDIANLWNSIYEAHRGPFEYRLTQLIASKVFSEDTKIKLLKLMAKPAETPEELDQMQIPGLSTT